MTRRRQRVAFVAGIAAVLVVMLILSPDVGSVWVFITGVGLVLAWVAGFTRTPRAVRAALRNTARSTARPRGTYSDIQDQEYRYFGSRWGVRGVVGASVFTATFTLITLAAGPAGMGDRLAMALAPALATFLLGYVAWVIPRLVVRVGPWGLESRELAGRVRMRWDQIVCAYSSRIYLSGAFFTSNLYVYSRDDVITINSKLGGFGELADLIRRHAPVLEEHAEREA